MGYATISAEVEVWVGDVLNSASADELREALLTKSGSTGDPQQVVRTAITQIQRGDTLDAITTLEREFFPKWSSVEQSRRDYEAAGKPAAEGA